MAFHSSFCARQVRGRQKRLITTKIPHQVKPYVGEGINSDCQYRADESELIVEELGCIQ